MFYCLEQWSLTTSWVGSISCEFKPWPGRRWNFKIVIFFVRYVYLYSLLWTRICQFESFCNVCAYTYFIIRCVHLYFNKNITCTENKSAKYCGAQKEMIYIEFKNRNDKETNGAKFKLKITAKKDYDCK